MKKVLVALMIFSTGIVASGQVNAKSDIDAYNKAVKSFGYPPAAPHDANCRKATRHFFGSPRTLMIGDSVDATPIPFGYTRQETTSEYYQKQGMSSVQQYPMDWVESGHANRGNVNCYLTPSGKVTDIAFDDSRR